MFSWNGAMRHRHRQAMTLHPSEAVAPRAALTALRYDEAS